MKLPQISLLLIGIFLFTGCSLITSEKPQVFVFTDINNVGGNLDDKQSLVHLLWYADELDIKGIVPDYWNGQGYEATMQVINAYEQDYYKINFGEKGYPHPDTIRQLITKNAINASQELVRLAKQTSAPLYVLVWGQMTTFSNILKKHPEIKDKIRLLTIGTGRQYGAIEEVMGDDCNVINWNGRGRKVIYDDLQFNDMWWLENNWTYNGMFMGKRPKEMLRSVSKYGMMGRHTKQVVSKHSWTRYFRVGDTPTVLYLVDPTNNLDDPTQGSWAGKFANPFPNFRPNYYTDDSGTIDWDYADPCNTWQNTKKMYTYNKSTLLQRREEMYSSLLSKLEKLYFE